MRQGPIDRTFLIASIILVVIGFFLFISASLGLLARDGASFSSVAFSQLFLGIFMGSCALLILSRIHIRHLKKYSLHVFIISFLLTSIVLIPHIGFEFNGAKRWLLLGPVSFQPAEFLKLGFVLYFAAWLSGVRDKLHLFRYTVVPFLILIGMVGTILLAQPDTGTFMVIVVTGFAMYFAAGARFRHVALLVGTFLTGSAALALTRPYLMDRLLSFMDPGRDPLGISYHIRQSLIAIGSGEWFGRGFGQSVQKFSYLPEPIGDAIFAVAAEEFGFIGSSILIVLFLFLAIRGLKIATKAPDYFSGLVVIGLVILIISQSFINIASMLGIFPLTGLPLLFVSHGGSALFFALAEVGIILSISRFRT